MSVSNDAVCHAWAHGNNKQGGNISTDGKRLISYSTDVAYNTGRGLVFISNDNMSPSTGKQLSYARRACSHLDVVSTPIFEMNAKFYDFDENEAFKMACKALNDQLEGYSKARLGKYLHFNMVQAENEVERLMTIAIKYRLPMPEFHELADSKLEAARVYAAQYEGKEQERKEFKRKREHARAEQQRILDASDFDAWRNGSGRCPSSYRNDASGGYYIAVRGDKVITSGGAECPVEHAQLAVKFWANRRQPGHQTTCACIVACKASAYAECDCNGVFKPWHRNGERVQLGAFQLDRIEADGTAYAGCHKFNEAELQRLAQVLL